MNFIKIFDDCTSKGTKIKKKNYLEVGKYPIIDQGQEQIAGYTNQKSGLFKEVPAIIFGDHTRIIKYSDIPFFLGADGVKILRCKFNDANYRYLYYALKNVKIPDTGYNRHFKWLKATNINYPNPIEQKKISIILDKISRVIKCKKQQLLELDILIKSRFVEMFGNPTANSKQWDVKKLVDVCNKLTDGTHFSPINSNNGDYKYITAKNIKSSGFDFSNITYVNREIHNSIYSRCNPEYGDILYIKDGITTGIAMINSLHEEFSLLSSVALLKQNRSILNGYYLCNVLNNNEMYNLIRKKMGGAAITRLTIAKLKVIEIPVPPIKLQEEFAIFVQQVEKLKIEVQKSLDEVQLLFDSLMQKYFD